MWNNVEYRMHIQNKVTCGFVCMCALLFGNILCFACVSAMIPSIVQFDIHREERQTFWSALASQLAMLYLHSAFWFASLVFKQKHKLLPLPCACANQLLVQEAAYDPHFKDEEAPHLIEQSFWWFGQWGVPWKVYILCNPWKPGQPFSCASHCRVWEDNMTCHDPKSEVAVPTCFPVSDCIWYPSSISNNDSPSHL